MSRSKRKNPVITEQQSRSAKLEKRFASKAVRNANDVPNGKAYRKYFCSWNISDYKSYCTVSWQKSHMPHGKIYRK